MKKVLLATGALMMTAGFAAAEVKVSGDGRMGVIYDGNDAAFTSRARVKFTLTGETDTGLSYGGSFRVHQSEGANKGTSGSVYVSGAYGKLSMGSVDNAAQAAITGLSGVGLTGLGDNNDISFLDGNYAKPAALYEYSLDNVTFYGSVGNPKGSMQTKTTMRLVDTVTGEVKSETTDIANHDNQYAIGVSYDAGDFKVGLGYETTRRTVLASNTSTTVDQWVISGKGTFGDATVTAVYANASKLDRAQYGASVDYKFGATTATGFVRRVEANNNETTYYGIGAEHDLGGGATFVAGLANSDMDGSKAVMDAGVKFKF